MAVKSAIESTRESGVGKAGVFRRLGGPMVLVTAALAAALLMAPTASAIVPGLTTTTSGTGYWVVTSGTTGRWLQSGTAVNATGNWVNGADANFTTSGTYTFGKLVDSGSAALGNITTGTGVFISFTDTTTGNVMNLGGVVKTFNFGAGSVVDFGQISTVAGNGITKNGAGTLALTGGAYTGGFTLNAGNVITRGASALGTGTATINGGAIGAALDYAAAGRTGPITVGGNFQIGITDSPASSMANMSFSNPGNGFNLAGSARTITLGSSGSMTFGQAITNGSLTLNRLASGSAGQFGLSGTNTISSLTLDSVQVNAIGNNAALGAGNVTLRGADATTLNISAALTLANTFTIADSAGTKTITNSGGNATINGKITNNDSTGGLTIGADNGRTLTIGAIDGTGTTGMRFGSSALLGTVLMTGTSNYAGDTRIDSSTLKMSATGYVPSGGNLVFQGSGRQPSISTVPRRPSPASMKRALPSDRSCRPSPVGN